MNRHIFAVITAITLGLHGCAGNSRQGTLAELERIDADVTEITLDNSLELAAQSYRRYLAETAAGPRTPEAMRRLADLQLEREYGVVIDGAQADVPERSRDEARSAADAKNRLAGSEAARRLAKPGTDKGALAAGLATPESARSAGPDQANYATDRASEAAETEQDFENRATAPVDVPSAHETFAVRLPGTEATIPEGPREAIRTYWSILQAYPGFERNDQVLYQLSRAYDEIGQPDQAMTVMDKLVAGHPDSKYVDEVHFRRGEYFFVRRKYAEAEDAYASIIAIGDTSSFYELALYKLGWSLYKRDFYEEALHHYVAMLDNRLATGYEFDRPRDAQEDLRVADTFRVISLSFSNLGGPEVLDEYFSEFGSRLYSDKVYSNLGEFYFTKLRYDDAASVYKSFVALQPFHKVAPHFSMRVVEIYREAGFSQLVVEAKKSFATDYALDAEYWNHFDVEQATEVVGFLKTNLIDLASHYHALYQDDELVEEQPANFLAAQQWYRQFLDSFPAQDESPRINYQLADLLLENRDFGAAAAEYERTAYGYAEHEQNAAAGYAAIFAHRQSLEAGAEAQRPPIMKATVGSSLRFAETFPQHEQAPNVLGVAADLLYELADHRQAIEVARKLVARYPESDIALRRSAWAVVAHSSIDLALYADAEDAYRHVLALTATDDESRADVVDGLAAAIYKQGEAANTLGDFRAAADHFLRIKDAAPGSAIRSAAEYDAAAALIKLEDWSMASSVLEAFRVSHPEHRLQTEATRNLAFVYRENGELSKSAVEHERIAAQTTDPKVRQEAWLTAGELYDQAQLIAEAIRVYERYVVKYPRPLDIAIETRSRLAEIFKTGNESDRYHSQLRAIVAADLDAGSERTDRSRFLAAKAALVLTTRDFEHFASLQIVHPLEQSLAQKQARMDAVMAALEALVDYQVAEVTAAATFYMAETFRNFGQALMQSDRPADLSASELDDYEMALEEEAFPFEERAIEVHQANFELLVSGVHNAWVRKSLKQLTTLMPGRYARPELSAGLIGTVDAYAYVAPATPNTSPPTGETRRSDAETEPTMRSDSQPQRVPEAIEAEAEAAAPSRTPAPATAEVAHPADTLDKDLE